MGSYGGIRPDGARECSRRDHPPGRDPRVAGGGDHRRVVHVRGAPRAVLTADHGALSPGPVRVASGSAQREPASAPPRIFSPGPLRVPGDRVDGHGGRGDACRWNRRLPAGDHHQLHLLRDPGEPVGGVLPSLPSGLAGTQGKRDRLAAVLRRHLDRPDDSLVDVGHPPFLVGGLHRHTAVGLGVHDGGPPQAMGGKRASGLPPGRGGHRNGRRRPGRDGFPIHRAEPSVLDRVRSGAGPAGRRNPILGLPALPDRQLLPMDPASPAVQALAQRGRQPLPFLYHGVWIPRAG